MKNQTLIIGVIILFTAVLIGNMVIAPWIFTVVIPSIGRGAKGEIAVTWLTNGTEVTLIDWGVVDNNTETSLHSLINITNIGDKIATLTLTTPNQVNITALTTTWNATSLLPVGASIIVQMNLTVTFSADTFSYDTRIDATG